MDDTQSKDSTPVRCQWENGSLLNFKQVICA